MGGFTASNSSDRHVERRPALRAPRSPAYRLPTLEEVLALPTVERVALRGQLVALLAVVAGDTLPPTDPALSPEDAVKVLGRYSVDWLRRSGPEWDAKLRAEFGIGFIMQPVENGKCHYSLAGLELLKRYWRGERARSTA